jgi:hypothetical protein
VAERKPHKGACADCGFSEPKMPEQGILQLPFVKRCKIVCPCFYVFYKNSFIFFMPAHKALVGGLTPLQNLNFIRNNHTLILAIAAKPLGFRVIT